MWHKQVWFIKNGQIFVPRELCIMKISRVCNVFILLSEKRIFECHNLYGSQNRYQKLSLLDHLTDKTTVHSWFMYSTECTMLHAASQQYLIKKKSWSLQLSSDCVLSLNFQVLTLLHTFRFHSKSQLFNIKIKLFINQSNDLGQLLTSTFKMQPSGCDHIF